MDPQSIFLDALPLIDRIVHAVGRRGALSDDERADFASWVKLRLLEDDYGIIRKFERRASFATYINVVINHLFLDYRNARWGRWRPSATARRLGRLAMRLEQLLHRDGCTLSEAVNVLCTTEEVTDEGDVRQLASQLPVRMPHREVGDGALWAVAAEEQTDDAILAEEQADEVRAAECILNEALRGLSAEDQTICRLIYWENFTVAEVARALRLRQKPLYRRIERLKARMRIALESNGIDEQRARHLLVGRSA
jgi:RNA polymerase sigma factor for flagellar operon FliA